MYMETIYFWSHKNGKYKSFSNWYPEIFYNENKIRFITNEHYMMYKKALLFNDKDKANEILLLNNPIDVKKKGREIKNFDENVWDLNKEKIVYEGCYLKFSQNENIKKLLLETEEKIIAEASPYDKIWGIGLRESDAKKGVNWNGQNLLGNILMKVRNKIRNDFGK